MTTPNPPKFEDVYADLAGRLRSIAIGKFGVPAAEAEEIVHDVFATYFAQQFNVRTTAERYLVAAVCNGCRDYWRRRGTEESRRGDFCRNDAETPSVEDRLAFHGALGAMLAELGERCRETLRRFYLDEQSAAEIAVAQETTEKYVFLVLHNCRKRARQIYTAISRPFPS